MDVLALTNVAAWSLQAAVVIATGAIALRLVGIDAPVIRHAWWRTLLVIALLLPFAQTWHPTPPATNVQAVDAQAAAADRPPLASAPASGRSVPAPTILARGLRGQWPWIVSGILLAGIALRLAWILAGVIRLRRLRQVGRVAPVLANPACDEAVALHQSGAEIRYVAQLGQPVTFGVFKPAVLLPQDFDDLPLAVQRAVLAHELWHVRRRDWAWVLVEEVVRAVFWFHPAMWWLVSQVQQSREEVVDELSVQLTSSRRGYLEALLAFADRPPVFPATPFARRRHLFERMLLISTEAVMSSRRIVASTVSAMLAVTAAGWYSTSAFPLTAADAAAVNPASAPAPAQLQAPAPPRDRRPGEPGPETAVERDLKASIAADPTKMVTYLQLSKLQQDRQDYPAAEATLISLTRAVPNQSEPLMVLANFYSRIGRFDQAVKTMEEVAAVTPSDPAPHQMLATFFWEKANKDASLSATEKLAHVRAGIAATDRALALNPNYVSSLAYKSLLLRMQAGLENNPTLITEANALQAQAMELRKAGVERAQQRMDFVPAPGQGGGMPPPPPPPPPPGAEMNGQAPVRVGAGIAAPMKIRDVRPAYPPIAQSARVQGVVIIETTIDTAGNVMDAHVLRSIPLLDEAALDAVRQWQFTPTLLNGAPVPVIMTVTVNFALQDSK
jgi:TonB family protein